MMVGVNGASYTWSIVDSGSGEELYTGGPYPGWSTVEPTWRRGLDVWSKETWSGRYNYDNTVVNEACCLPPGRYQLTCQDALGEGWSVTESEQQLGSFIAIGLAVFCNDFTSGRSYQVDFVVNENGVVDVASEPTSDKVMLEHLPSFSLPVPVTCHARALNELAGETVNAQLTQDVTVMPSGHSPFAELPVGSLYRPEAWWSFNLSQVVWVSTARTLCVFVWFMHVLMSGHLMTLASKKQLTDDVGFTRTDKRNLYEWIGQTMLFGYMSYRLHMTRLGPLVERVTALLSSIEWLISDETEYFGTLRRLRMIKAIGAPPMMVLPYKTLLQLGRIPRSTEGYTVDAELLLKQGGRQGINTTEETGTVEFSGGGTGWELATGNAAEDQSLQIVFVSHRWLSDNHPDDADHTKAKAVIAFCQWFRAQWGVAEVAIWIDYSSVDQDDTAKGITTLPLYIAAARNIVCYETDDYEVRSWCRLERCLSYAFCFNGKQPFTIRGGFTNVQQRPRIEVRLLSNPSGSDSKLTDQKDRVTIDGLSAAAVASSAFTFRAWLVKEAGSIFLSRRVGRTIYGILMIMFMVGFWPSLFLDILSGVLSDNPMSALVALSSAGTVFGSAFWLTVLLYYYKTLAPLTRAPPSLGASEVETRTLSPKLVPQAALAVLFDKYATGVLNTMNENGQRTREQTMSKEDYTRFLHGIGYAEQFDRSVRGRHRGRVTLTYLAIIFVAFTFSMGPIPWCQISCNLWIVFVAPFWFVGGVFAPCLIFYYPRDWLAYGSNYFKAEGCTNKMWRAHVEHLHEVRLTFAGKERRLDMLCDAGLTFKQFKRWYTRFSRSLIHDYAAAFRNERGHGDGDLEIVRRMFEQQLSQEDVCAICFDQLDPDRAQGAHQPKTISCGHTFHHGCFLLLRKAPGEAANKCPVCRQHLEDDELTRVQDNHDVVIDTNPMHGASIESLERVPNTSGGRQQRNQRAPQRSSSEQEEEEDSSSWEEETTSGEEESSSEEEGEEEDDEENEDEPGYVALQAALAASEREADAAVAKAKALQAKIHEQQKTQEQQQHRPGDRLTPVQTSHSVEDLI